MRIVRVDWTDATGGVRGGWRSLVDIRKAAQAAPAVSYGALLHEDEKLVIICPHFVGDRLDEGDGEVTIPKEWVTKITDLKPVRTKKAQNSKADVVAE